MGQKGELVQGAGGRAPLNLKGKWQVGKAAFGQVPLAPFMVGSSFFLVCLSVQFLLP